jgi:tetratricopeptide (TPR) repeat protein
MGMFTPQTTSEQDSVARALGWVSRLCLIGAVSLTPLLFVPSTLLPLLDGKVFIIAILLSVALVVSALLVLRIGTFEVPASGTLAGAWFVVVAALIAGGLSGDTGDSLQAITGGTYTVGIITIGMFTLTLMAIAARQTASAWWIAVGLLGSSCVLLVWHALRLLSGQGLSFGFFPNQTTSPLGSWTDVGILAAGLVLALLLTIGSAALQKWQRWAMFASLVAALFVLLVINTTALWVILGVISLTVVVMSIARRQAERTPSMMEGDSGTGTAGWLLGFAGTIFIAAMMVYLGGNWLQQTLAERTDSSFVEIRPSVSASLDIVRGVWGSDVLTGVGPNRYADAWRVHKADTINQTLFWNTDFSSGHNFILTQAVESGLLGLVAWLLFFGLLLVSGVRTFLLTDVMHRDVRYHLALVSFILASYVWVMTFFTNIGTGVFIIGCALTGLYIGLSFSIRPRQLFAVSLLNNQRMSYVVVASLVLVIIIVVWLLQQMTEQVMAAASQNRALTTEGTVDEVSERLGQAFVLYQDDATARTDAIVHLARVRQLVNVAQPTGEQQQAFQRSAVSAVRSSQTAVELDPTNPDNWYIQAQAYGVLAQSEVEGALDLAQQAVDAVRPLDPKSPEPDFLAAELAVARGDIAAAREAATQAIQKKRDYTPALLLLAQIEIADGNVEEAIAVTTSILSFDPENPARWYQLGVLLQANEQPVEAIAAMSQAIALNDSFANALYVRGLLLATQNELELAQADLERVAELNPENETVRAQIEQLANAEPVVDTVAEIDVANELEASVDAETVTDEDAEDVAEAAAETDLVTTTTSQPEGDEASETTEETTQ